MRLNHTEVETLSINGVVKETVEFSDDEKLEYFLEVSQELKNIQARFVNGSISVQLPAQIAEKWTLGDEEGLQSTQPLKSGKSLKILIEKDYACLKPREGEDDSEAFPHPLRSEVC